MLIVTEKLARHGLVRVAPVAAILASMAILTACAREPPPPTAVYVAPAPAPAPIMAPVRVPRARG